MAGNAGLSQFFAAAILNAQVSVGVGGLAQFVAAVAETARVGTMVKAMPACAGAAVHACAMVLHACLVQQMIALVTPFALVDLMRGTLVWFVYSFTICAAALVFDAKDSETVVRVRVLVKTWITTGTDISIMFDATVDSYAMAANTFVRDACMIPFGVRHMKALITLCTLVGTIPRAIAACAADAVRACASIGHACLVEQMKTFVAPEAQGVDLVWGALCAAFGSRAMLAKTTVFCAKYAAVSHLHLMKAHIALCANMSAMLHASSIPGTLGQKHLFPNALSILVAGVVVFIVRRSPSAFAVRPTADSLTP